MKRRALVLFSGGLDSMLAVRILQTQGIDVVALNFQTIFTSVSTQAQRAAQQLEVPLTTIAAGDDYLDLVRTPRFGYGQGANPCLDCRIYLLRRAVPLMQKMSADFLATGDVIGQRLMGQKRRDLDIIAFHGGCEDLLLRPLCAQRLPPTKPEREGWVDRMRLYNYSGTGRRKMIALARRLGIAEIPPQTVGCALVEKSFAAKVHQLVQLEDVPTAWDYELLKIGRHFVSPENCKVVVGRNAGENETLEQMHTRRDARQTSLLTPGGFNGPSALLVAPTASPVDLEFAVAQLLHYTHDRRASGGHVLLRRAATEEKIPLRSAAAPDAPRL